MKRILVTSIIAIAVLAGCEQQKLTTPALPESFPFRATITPDNKCSVDALGKTYTSVGQVRGVVLPAFSGTLDNQGYHAVGCWVGAPDGSGGDLAVLFEGESLGKQFETGTFLPRFEPTYGGTAKVASVSFMSTAIDGGRLATIDQSTGTIVVDPINRTIHVDVSVIKYQM